MRKLCLFLDTVLLVSIILVILLIDTITVLYNIVLYEIMRAYYYLKTLPKRIRVWNRRIYLNVKFTIRKHLNVRI